MTQSEIDFQPYLRSLIDTYEKWWEEDAFMDEIRDAWFEFVLDGRTKRDKPVNGQEEIVKPILDLIADHAHQKILIAGDPGAGKSTLLKRLLLNAARKAEEDAQSPIPVLVELKEYRTTGEYTGIRGLILESLESHDPSLDEDALKCLLTQKRLLLLADGLNELTNEQVKAELKKLCRHQAVIATSRNANDWWDIDRTITIQPLTPQQTRQFLEKRLPNQDRAEVEKLGDRVRDFGQTPLMAWMLFSIFQSNQEIPTTRGEAYRSFTTLYIERAKEGIDLAESQFLLSKLAFEMTQAQELIDEISAQNLLESTSALNQVLNTHLFQASGKPGNRKVRFCHQSLQEYYAAEYLLPQLSELIKDEERFKQDYLNYRKWTESIVLMLTLVDKEAQALQVIELALEVDPYLGARLAGETRQSFREQSINLILGRNYSEYCLIRLLGVTHSKEAISYLQDFLNRETFNEQELVFRSLQQIGTRQAIFILKDAIFSEADITTRRAALLRLSEIPDQESIETLIQIVSDKSGEPDLRFHAAALLGRLKYQFNDKKEDIDSLLWSIAVDRNEDSNIRANAIWDMKIIDNEVDTTDLHTYIFEGLSTVLRDEDSHLSWIASLMLGGIGDKKAMKILRNALRSENPFVRRNAASGLSQIKEKDSFHAVFQAVREEFGEVNKTYYSSEVGSYLHYNPLPQMICRLGDLEYNLNLFQYLCELIRCEENIDICRSAIVALGKIGKEKAIPILVEAASGNIHPDTCLVPMSATEALGDTETTEVIPILENLLDDENPWIREGAIAGLEKIKSVDIIPALIRGLQDNHPTIKYMAAVAFDNIALDLRDECVNAIDDLVKCLDEGNADARFHAAQALWKIGDTTRATDSLIRILQNEDNSRLRMTAARALGKSQITENQEIIEILLSLLKDSDLGTRMCAAEALGEIAEPSNISELQNLSSEISDDYIDTIDTAIETIQKRCGFYNHEVDQLRLETRNQPGISGSMTFNISQVNTLHTQTMNSTPNNQPTFHISKVGNLNTGDVTIEGNQIGIQHNYPSDLDIKNAALEMEQLLKELQTRYPHVNTETEALEIIDVEFTTIQQSSTNRFVTLRKQLLNPERHLQAMKATLVEVAKHYLEESVWAKAGITYIDTLSEKPDQGV